MICNKLKSCNTVIIYVVLVYAYLAASQLAAAQEVEKLCWAHYVPWAMAGQNSYDLWEQHPEEGNPLSDVSLNGNDVMTLAGTVVGLAKEIETAQSWGIDGFTVDVTEVKNISAVMRVFYRAAEGTNFKISLCIDTGSDDVDEMTRSLGAFISEFRDHPNSFCIAGKMLITAFAIRMSYENWGKVRQQLKEKDLDAYYAIMPMNSSERDWDNIERLREIANYCDGFYDFGCNGFSRDEMTTRLRNAQAALGGKDAILIAGIAQGYLRTTRGMYRPYLNTQSLRDSWSAAIAAHAQQVCLTTWNDYMEHTQFAPSAVNRTALLRINREYLAQWRGEESIPRFGSFILSYHEAILFGDDLTLEIIGLSHTKGNEKVWIRFLNEDNTVFREYDEIEMNRDIMDVVTIRLTDDELADARLLRVQAAVTRTPDEKPEYTELSPIVRRLGVTWNPRTTRVPLSELSNRPLVLSLTDGSVDEVSGTRGDRIAHVQLRAWTAAGKLELLRNGYPIGCVSVNHHGAATTTFDFSVPENERTGRDVLYARFSDLSNWCSFSNPVSLASTAKGNLTTQPYIVTGADFDEAWILWKKPITRIERPYVQKRTFEESDLFSVQYDFNSAPISRKKERVVMPSGGWQIPLTLFDCNQNAYIVSDNDSLGEQRRVLAFDGKNYGQLSAFCFPCGAFTMEFLLKRDDVSIKDEGEGLLIDGSGVSVRLNAKKHVVVERKGRVVTSTEPLKNNVWYHIAVVHDLAARELIIYLDGKEVGRGPSSWHKLTCNSGSRLGNDWNGNGFQGKLGGFSLEGAVRLPTEFKLLQRE